MNIDSYAESIYNKQKERTTITSENIAEFSSYRSIISHIPIEGVKGKLYLSSQNILGKLDEFKIDHLISCMSIEPVKINTLKQSVPRYLTIQHDQYMFEDSQNGEDSKYLLENMDQIVDSIHNSLLQGKTVGIHCKVGVSRSASIVLYYLSKYRFHNLSVLERLEFSLYYLTQYRPIICPNPSFIKVLLNKIK